MAEKSVAAPVLPIDRKYHGCSSIKDYELMEKLGEGTFGEVYKGRSRKSGSIVALKKILLHNEKDGFPITSLREIKLLKTLSHINVIKLDEMAVERNKAEPRKRAILYMVTPYMDHDLSGLLDNPDVRMTEPQIKCYMLQLFRGLKYLHNSRILHRDMKAANLLVNNRGILQIADFGLARHYDGPVPEAGKGGGTAVRDYTSLVVTRWYRPPELLLQLRSYTTAIDMWGAGCVFGEMFKRKPILPGHSDIHQAQVIFEMVGSPNEKVMPGWEKLPGADLVKSWGPEHGKLEKVFRELHPQGLSLLRALLTLNWKTRINAIDALEHPYFKTAPLPARPEEIPRFAASHELDRRNKGGAMQNLPPAPQGGTVGGGANGDWQDPEQSTGGLSRDKALGTQGRTRPNWGQDRGPPGVAPPPNRDHHGSRVLPLAGDSRGLQRRGAWQPENNSSRPLNEHNAPGRSSLPPPPGEGARHPLPLPPHHANRLTQNMKDTYIPSYSGGGGRRDERRDERRREYRSRDRSVEPRDSQRFGKGSRGDDRRADDRRAPVDYTDLDAPGNSRDDRGSSRYRDYDRGGGRDRRSTRSRSPDRRGSDRDKYRERERDR